MGFHVCLVHGVCGSGTHCGHSKGGSAGGGPEGARRDGERAGGPKGVGSERPRRRVERLPQYQPKLRQRSVGGKACRRTCMTSAEKWYGVVVWGLVCVCVTELSTHCFVVY
jgi:hypothetical protein